MIGNVYKGWGGFVLRRGGSWASGKVCGAGGVAEELLPGDVEMGVGVKRRTGRRRKIVGG